MVVVCVVILQPTSRLVAPQGEESPDSIEQHAL